MDELPESRFYRVVDLFRRSPEIIVLSALILVYMILANIYAYPATFNGTAFPTSGGSDPFYNYRAIIYTLQNHTWLTHDNLLNYPLGANNPRTPFFHFFIIMVAFIVSPFVNIYNAATVGLLEFDAVFGALLILPVYLITKELFGKRAGLVGALLYALMPSNLSSGILSDGRMHTPELIFAFFAIYFFQKALNTVSKGQVMDRLLNVKGYYSLVRKYLGENRLGVIYVLLAGTSLGALALAWQGFAYIEAIIVIYIFVQLVLNLFLKRPSGYIIILSVLFFLIGLTLPAYYYVGLGNAKTWLLPAIYLGLVTVGFASVVGILGRKPWIISFSILVVVSGIAFAALDIFYHSFITYLVSGSGYFVKTRVYQTIAEASSPPLGQYISGFGSFQFIIGAAGIAYVVYVYLKDKKESTLFIMVFSLISIYMSFAAARFNVTAAPAYAALGAGLLVYLADMIRIHEMQDRKASEQMGVRKSIKGNIKALHVGFVILIVLTLIIPSASSMLNAAVPANTANSINNEIYNSLPSFLRPLNYSANNGQFVGTYGFYITNDSQPLSQSLLWLGNQDTNLPIDQRPAYVSWWDYGFQEINQGKHPTVADDFQQGYQVAGQVLLAQNQSQIISLFLARDVQGSYVRNGSLTPQVFNALSTWFGSTEAKNISAYLTNANQYSYLIQNNPKIYGKYIQDISAQNAYFALVSGQLSNYFSTSTIVNAYQDVSQVTGFYIKYIGVTTSGASLLPFSGNNTGIFYAPAYLTDHLSYNYQGEIVPYTYYNIYATTTNQTYPLNQLPTGVIPTGYNIKYNPAFYNTSIYRFLIGYPPSVVGQSGGLPGITYGVNNMTLEPAWNMSHFIVEYYPILYNPYKDFQAHPSAWTLISLQQGYAYQKAGKGTVLLFPPPNQVLSIASPIVAYYPGATISGRVTTASGVPVQGVYATIYDQYGVPHQVVTTNANGYYNLTGLPGNDTVILSSQTFSSFFLTGNKIMGDYKVNVSMDQANRIPTSFNATSGLPDYYITHNFQLNNSQVSGNAKLQYQYGRHATKQNPEYFTKTIQSGQVIFSNSTYHYNASTNITNGQYNFNDLPPYNYSVSVVTGGKTYSNIIHAVVSPGTSTVYNVYITFDVLYAHVQTQDGPSTGFSITATSGINSYTNVTNSTGDSILWVEPGNYSVTAHSMNATSLPQIVSFTDWIHNTTLNLTPAISAVISGTITGSPVPLNLTFYRNGQITEAYTVLSQQKGSYSATLPIGTYTVYASYGNSAFMKTVQLYRTAKLDIILGPAYNVSMQSAIPGSKSYDQIFEVLSQNILFSTNLSGVHQFTMMLPSGQYQFASYALAAGNLYSGLAGRDVVSNSGIQLQLSFNKNLTVNTFDSSAGSTFNSATQLGGGISVLYYSNYPIYFAESLNGTSPIHYPNLAQSLLTIHSYSPGFHSAVTQVTSGTVKVGLQPYLVNVTVVVGGSNFNGTVKLVGIHTYTETVKSGTASFSAETGLYSIRVSSAQMTLNLTNSIVSIPAVGNYTYVPSYISTFSVKSSNSNVELFAPSGQSINPDYVPLGNYTVYITQGSQVNITNMYVNGNVTLNPSFSQGFQLLLANSESLRTGYYIISDGKYVLNTSRSSILLPSGTYKVNYENIITGSSGDYKIQGYSTASLFTSAQSVNVSVVKTEIFSIVSGSIIGNNVTTVSIYNTTGVLINQTISTSAGTYSVGVPGGKYTLYAINGMGTQAFLASFNIKAFSSYSLNIPLKQAYRTYIHTSLSGKQTAMKVDIQSRNISLEYNSSNSYIILPVGSYAFGASQILSFKNYTGSSVDVTYLSNTTSLVSGTTYVNLNLARQDVYAFNLTQVTKTQKVLPETNVSYNFTLENTGNTNVTVTLSSGNSTWGMNFSSNEFSLKSGQTVHETVTINVSKKAFAGLNSVPIAVDYGLKQNFTGYVSVNVQKVYNFTLVQQKFTAIPNGNFFEVPVNITNTGNTPITLSLNLNDTVISYFGWVSNVSYNGTNVTKLSLSNRESKIVDVVFYPVLVNQTQQLPGGNVTLTLTGPNGNVKDLVIPASYPSTPTISPYPVGPNILGNYTGNPYSSLITGVIIIVIAVVAGLLLAATRGRKRGGGR